MLIQLKQNFSKKEGKMGDQEKKDKGIGTNNQGTDKKPKPNGTNVGFGSHGEERPRDDSPAGWGN